MTWTFDLDIYVLWPASWSSILLICGCDALYVSTLCSPVTVNECVIIVQLISCNMFGAKPLYELMLTRQHCLFNLEDKEINSTGSLALYPISLPLRTSSGYGELGSRYPFDNAWVLYIKMGDFRKNEWRKWSSHLRLLVLWWGWGEISYNELHLESFQSTINCNDSFLEEP